MRMRSTLLLVLATVIGGCGGPSYDGAVEPPTAHIDVYFDGAAVEQGFTTMGTLSVTTGGSLAELESSLAAAGMERGADAIIIDGMASADARSVASHRAEANGRPRYIQDAATGSVRNVGGSEHHGRLSTPTSATVTARLLKYDR